MKALRDALILAWMKVYPALRHNPIEMVFVLIVTGGLPLFFLAIFWGQQQIPHGLVGAFVTSAALLAVYTAAQELIWDNQTKLRQILVAKPITPLSYALGTGLAALLYSLPGLLIFGGILLYRGVLPPLALPLAFLAMLAAWAAMSTLGFTISTYFLNASPFRVNAVTNIIAFGAAFISPVYYPADLLERWPGRPSSRRSRRRPPS